MLLIRDNVERIVPDQKIAEKMIAEEGYKEVPEKIITKEISEEVTEETPEEVAEEVPEKKKASSKSKESK